MTTMLKDKIDAVAAALTLNPAASRIREVAVGELVGDFRVEVQIGGHTMTVDMPEGFGGGGAGPTPGAYALIGLASCQAVTYRLWSERMGVRLDGLRIQVVADVDVRSLVGVSSAERAGFGNVEIVLTVTGPEPPERYEQVRREVEQHSPIFDVFAHPVPTRLALTTA